MDTGTALGIAGIIITIIVGVLFASKKIKKCQKNEINITATSNSTIHANDIIAGDNKSDMNNEK